MMRKRFRLLGVLALVLALLMPSMAFGWDLLPDGQMWAGEVGSNHCATVHAGVIYDAATYAVGSDPNKISASVRVKLSDPNYGGRFYEYAQTFHKMESWDDYPEWLPGYVGVAQLISNGLIGDFNIYNSEASSTLYNGAVLDFQRVLAGEDLSGGGSTSGDYYTMTLSAADVVSTASQSDINNAYIVAVNATFDSGSVVAGSGTTNFSFWLANPYYVSSVTLYISPAVQQFISDAGAAGKHVLISTWPYAFGASRMQIRVIVCDSYEVRRVQVDRENQCYYKFTNGVLYAIAVSSFYHDSNGFFAVLDSVPSVGSSRDEAINAYYGYVGDVYVPPSGDWPEPETPATPTAPEIPTPTAPTITTDPTIVAPTVSWPEITINVEPTPEGLDYTELLRAINNNLNSLRSDLNQEFDSVISSLRNIYQYLQHLDSMLERHCKHIRDSIEDNVYELELWLKSLFEWLPEQLDYDADLNFDDSELRYLLRRILNKIPGGSTSTPTTYKPNPQADEPGFFDWLLDLWHRFLIDLVSVLPDELGGLVDAFSQLTHYFPFSIPWDLFALLLLFEHEPVTPVFQIPWGYGGGDGQAQMITIDLSVWDGVMAMVRPVFLVGFCFKLALITKDLLAGFDLSKGGV